jgi:hypothetical protein
MRAQPTPFRPTQFKVHLKYTRWGYGCEHGMNFQEGCRPCSVHEAMVESGLKYEVLVEEATLDRIVMGRTETREQGRAIALLIAFAYGHPDPLGLL